LRKIRQLSGEKAKSIKLKQFFLQDLKNQGSKSSTSRRDFDQFFKEKY